MKAKILSLNVGCPRVIDWQGKSIETSMLKSQVPQLDVGRLSIEGDSFAQPQYHGRPDSVLYAYGLDAITDLLGRLGRESYINGELGENITVDTLNERDVSVGDVFKIGSVIAQATFPRIPCAKINFRLEHPAGQKTMIATGRSGIYFRIIKPGTITLDSQFELFERATARFSISDVYARMMGATKVSAQDLERVRANGAFPMDRIARWLPS